MMNLTTILRQQEPINPEQADHITALWLVSLRSPIATDEQCDEVARALSAVNSQARPSWVMARVAALLSQYYAADVPQAAVSMMAEDWLEELRDYPEWAITKAVRWWKSEANADRKKRPLEGDISARAKFEMQVVRFADRAVRRYWEGYRPMADTPREVVPPEPEMTEEEREASRKRVAAMAAELGAAKRVGGAA